MSFKCLIQTYGSSVAIKFSLYLSSASLQFYSISIKSDWARTYDNNDQANLLLSDQLYKLNKKPLHNSIRTVHNIHPLLLLRLDLLYMLVLYTVQLDNLVRNEDSIDSALLQIFGLVDTLKLGDI